jgi:hypothetical protein
MMVFAPGALLVIKGGRPITEAHRAASKLVKGLAQEFGASPAEVNKSGFTASFGDWSYAEEAQRLKDVIKSAALGTKGAQQARTQSIPGAGQIVEQSPVRMLGKELSDLLIVLADKRC